MRRLLTVLGLLAVAGAATAQGPQVKVVALFSDRAMLEIDGKQRLLRPLRVEQLRFLADRLRGGGLDRQLYLCMESDEVWRAVLDRTPEDLGGLYRHLMARAFGD